MKSVNYHTIYTAEDLLRYVQGQMTQQQMNALEKAALEDSFLAEALEGYITASSTISNSPLSDTNKNEVIRKLQILKDRINTKANSKEGAKVTSFYQKRWLQYAVAACLIAFGGWWLISISNTSHEKENTIVIAQNKPVTQSFSADSLSTSTAKTPTLVPSTSDFITLPTDDNPKKKDKEEKGIAQNKSGLLSDGAVNSAETGAQADMPPSKQEPSVPQQNTETINEDLLKKEQVNESPIVGSTKKATMEKQEEERKSTDDKTLAYKSLEVNKNKAVTTADQKSGEKEKTSRVQTQNTNPGYRDRANIQQYDFKGQIVDTKNNPLPYSNITIPNENLSLYSDAKGNFNFGYIDSTVSVQAQSFGYTSRNFNMRSDIKQNRIVLEEDRESSNKKTAERREKQTSKKRMITEYDLNASAEPGIGWDDYTTYLLNNNRVTVSPSDSRSVQLSFRVNKDGEVRDISIEQSGGKEPDQEAIRLLKEGPKWKVKYASKNRIKVSFEFQ